MSGATAYPNKPTRTCQTCHLVTRRSRLLPTEDGYLVCPRCQTPIEIYAGLDLIDPTSYVLKVRSNSGSAGSYHLPSFVNPLKPRCNITNQRNVTYTPIAPDVVPDRYSLCENCATLHPKKDAPSQPSETEPPQPTVATDLSTTVWFTSTGDAYHADAGGMPACPDVIPNADEHTLREARAQDKRACEQCNPDQYPETDSDHDSNASPNRATSKADTRPTKLGDFA